MKRFLPFSIFLLAGIFLSITTFAQVDSVWTKLYGGSQDEPVYYGDPGQAKLSVTKNGDIYIVTTSVSNDGYVGSNNGYADVWVLKLDKNGDTLWTKVIGGSDGDIAGDVMAMDDEGCVIVGYTYSKDGIFATHHGGADANEDGFIIRLDKDGNQKWMKMYGGSYNASIGSAGHDLLQRVQLISDGSLLVMGKTSSMDGDLTADLTKFTGIWVLNVDADSGKVLFSDKIVSVTHMFRQINFIANFVELSDGSGYVLLGETSYYAAPYMNLVMKLDKSFKKVWEHEYGGKFDNRAHDIKEIEYGNFLMLSHLSQVGRGDVTKPYLGGYTDIWVVKLNPKGEIIDQIVLGGSNGEIPYCIEPDGKGNYMIGAQTLSIDSFVRPSPDTVVSDFWIANINTDLDTLWTKRFGGSYIDGLAGIKAIENGNYFITSGRTQSNDWYCQGNNGKQDVWVGKFNNPAPYNFYIACGDSVKLEYFGEYKGGNSLTYSWTPTTALSDAVGSKTLAAPSQTTVYTLNVTDGNGFTDKKTMTVHVKELIIDAGFDENIYCGDSIQLSTSINSKANFTYQWSPSIGVSDSTTTTPYMFPATTTEYTIKASAANGCSAEDKVVIKKNVPIEICMVENSDNKTNRVMWERPAVHSIDSFGVYRDTIGLGSYHFLGYKSSSIPGVYVDNTMDINGISKPISYKISTYACGVNNGESQPHTTIFLDAVFSKDTSWNLAWTGYQGNNYREYAIFMGTSKGNLKRITETYNSVLNFRDIDAPSGKVFYQIRAFNNVACNPIGLEGFGFSTTASNIVEVVADSNLAQFKNNRIEDMPDLKDIYFEDFQDDLYSMPADIIHINYDSILLAIGEGWYNSWVVEVDLDDDLNYNAATASVGEKPGNVDNWMILPKMSIKENTILGWRARSLSPDWRESYEVRVSTTDTNTTDFIHIVYANKGESDLWTNRVVDLSYYGFENQDIYVAFRYISDDRLLFVMDDIRLFTADSLLDVSVISSKVPEFGITGTTYVVDGELMHYGTEEIKSIKVNYMIEGESTVYDKVYNNVSITAYSGIRFQFDQKWTPLTEGSYKIKIWASEINGKADEKPVNDTLTVAVEVLDYFPTKNVLIEEVTGAWCGFCTGGAVVMDEILKKNPKAIGVSVHSSDIMQIDAGYYLSAAYVTGVPAAIIDRTKISTEPTIATSNTGVWEDLVNIRSKVDVPVEVKSEHEFDSTGMSITIDIDIKLFTGLNGDYRVNAYIVEDSVFSINSEYFQVNYFDAEPSHPMEGRGNPIEDYYHRHVLRAMLGNTWGTSGVLPATMKKGDKFTHQYTTTLDAGIDPKQVHVIALVQKYDADEKDREILNVAKSHDKADIGVKEMQNADANMTIFPNPASDYTLLAVNFNKKQKATVSIVDVTGKEVYSSVLGEMETDSKYKFVLNTSSFAKGVYMVTVRGETTTKNEKLVITR